MNAAKAEECFCKKNTPGCIHGKDGCFQMTETGIVKDGTKVVMCVPVDEFNKMYERNGGK